MVRMISIFAVLSLGTGLDGLEEEEDGGIPGRGGIEELKDKGARGKEGNEHRIVELSIGQGRLRGTWKQDVEGRTIKRQGQMRKKATNFLTIY